jgi:hypothetical protein
MLATFIKFSVEVKLSSEDLLDRYRGACRTTHEPFVQRQAIQVCGTAYRCDIMC